MFVIRRNQMEAFSEYMVKSFEKRMVDHLQSIFPGETRSMDPNALGAFVEGAIRRAQGYDIQEEESLARYLECSMRLGERFDIDPGLPDVGAILRRTDCTDATKMNLIAAIAAGR